MKVLERPRIEEQGQDLVEYALPVVLISLGADVAIRSLATAVRKVFSNATENLSAAES